MRVFRRGFTEVGADTLGKAQEQQCCADPSAQQSKLTARAAAC